MLFVFVIYIYYSYISFIKLILLALKGLKREAAPTRKHLPVTPQILLLIKRYLTPNYKDLLFWAATLTAFFGFLGVSEFTTSASFDPTTDLGPFDVQFNSLADSTYATIVLRHPR